jgi:hypothetical protein
MGIGERAQPVVEQVPHCSAQRNRIAQLQTVDAVQAGSDPVTW